MKMKNVLFGFSLFLIAVLAVSCSGPWTGADGVPAGQGTLTIVWGNAGNSRAFVQPEEIAGLQYEIILTGPGGEIITDRITDGKTDKTYTIAVGTWSVTIKGYRENPQMPAGEFCLMGVIEVNVTPGTNTPKKMPVYTATEVSSWGALTQVIGENNQLFIENDVTREEIFILKNFVDDGNYGTINIIRPVIIIAETYETAGWFESGTINSFPTLFNIERGGSLTLGKPGMSGSIVFKNNPNAQNDSLIKVNTGILVMNNNITLQGGYAENGGGVYVSADSAFSMNGGLITGNKANNKGGGVYVEFGGTFTQNGGIVDDNFTMEAAGGFVENEEYSNVFLQPEQRIAGLYLDYDAAFTLYGSISQPGDISQQTGILKLTKNTIDFTPSGVAEPSITITNLWTGDDVESQFVVSPNSPDVKYDVTWAFLYEGDSKIGIILHKIANERNVTAYYLGNDALVFRRDQTALDNYDFGNIGQLYTGTGESVETGSLGIELDLK